jgi:hypothetical protein
MMHMKMFCKISLILTCFAVANVQASQPDERRFTKGGFFTGAAMACGIPIFVVGRHVSIFGKRTLERSIECLSHDLRREAMREIWSGVQLKTIGAGLVIIPFLFNNNPLLNDRARQLRAYCMGYK